jgi:hypothetical protein
VLKSFTASKSISGFQENPGRLRLSGVFVFDRFSGKNSAGWLLINLSALVRAVAEGWRIGFAAAASPDGAVFLNRNHFGGFARPFVGAVAVGRILALSAAAESEGLT